MSTHETKVLAFALEEIRNLLAGHLGSDATSELSVRIAAHIAYALHNEAAAVIEGSSFNAEKAIDKIQAIDAILSVTEGTTLSTKMRGAA